MNNSDKYLIEELEEISKATVIKEEVIQTPALLDGVIQLREISFERQGLVVRKTVLHFWGIRNNIMMDYLVQNQIKINTIFCKRLRGECLLETNLEQSLNLLNTKYFISDLNHLRDGEFDFLRAENFGRQNGLTIKSHSDYSRTIGYNPEYVFCFERQ